MAAGLGFKTFTTGEVLTAADTNGYLMQGVLVFASAAARDAAITSPQEGQFAYLKDTNVTTYYTGSVWANLDTTGMTNPMTTTGDTIYSSSGSTPARLGIGSTGQVLTVSGGIPSWATAASGAKFGQIVQADSTSQTTITSATFVASALTATITPTSATSKVLVQVTIPFYGPGGGQQMDLAIFRGTVAAGTNLSPSNSLLWGTRAELQSGAMLFLDSPATASAQVYEIGAQVAGGTGYTINSPSRGVITLTEVLA